MQSEGSQYEIFEHAKVNNLKRVRELLDIGVDVNLVDFDNGNTPLHYACSNGAKQTMEFLIQKGANVNAQNDKGVAPLHMLITKRYDALALWLVREGADLNLPDKRNYTPRDLALSWFQVELDEEEPQKTASVSEERSHVANDEVMKIYLSNGSYKSINITPDMTAEGLAKSMAEKLNLPSQYGSYFEVLEIKKEQQRRLASGENILDVKFKWPLIFGKTGNETMLHCKFLLRIKQGSPADVVNKFQAAMN